MFNGIWLVASEPLTVRGRQVQTGERFELSRIHAGALLVMGRAQVSPAAPTVPIPDVPVVAPPVPRRRGRPRKTEIVATPVSASADVIPSERSTADIEEIIDRPKRRYRRRDLQADEA